MAIKSLIIIVLQKRNWITTCLNPNNRYTKTHIISYHMTILNLTYNNNSNNNNNNNNNSNNNNNNNYSNCNSQQINSLFLKDNLNKTNNYYLVLPSIWIIIIVLLNWIRIRIRLKKNYSLICFNKIKVAMFLKLLLWMRKLESIFQQKVLKEVLVHAVVTTTIIFHSFSTIWRKKMNKEMEM